MHYLQLLSVTDEEKTLVDTSVVSVSRDLLNELRTGTKSYIGGAGEHKIEFLSQYLFQREATKLALDDLNCEE